MKIPKTDFESGKKFLAEGLGFLALLPTALLINRYLPVLQVGRWNLDLLFSFLLALALVRIVLDLFRPMMLPGFMLLASYFMYSQYTGGYSLTNAMHDYRTWLTDNWTNRDDKKTSELGYLPDIWGDSRTRMVHTLQSKADFQDSLVRNFAVQHSLDNFDAYFDRYELVARELSLFKYINSHFHYVSDPYGNEYYATPRETILNGLGGDCDDHALLMGSCMESIGGKARLVIVKDHMYPELYVGNKADFQQFQQAVFQLFKDDHITRLNYHEHNGEYWINLDYSAPYPGGPYLNNEVYAVVPLPS